MVNIALETQQISENETFGILTRLVRKLGHINVVLEIWAQLFQENLGTGRFLHKVRGDNAVDDGFHYAAFSTLFSVKEY